MVKRTNTPLLNILLNVQLSVFGIAQQILSMRFLLEYTFFAQYMTSEIRGCNTVVQVNYKVIVEHPLEVVGVLKAFKDR